MKKSTARFLLGLTAGALIGAHWRSLAKQGIQAGIVAGRKLKDVSEQAMEEIEDLTAEATDELAANEQTT